MDLFTPLLHAYVDSSWLVFVGVNVAQRSPLLRVAEQQLLHDKGIITKGKFSFKFMNLYVIIFDGFNGGIE